MARDFSPRVNFQCRLSYVYLYTWCAITRINICVHIKDPVVNVRVWWIMETLKYPACTLGWVPWLSQLAFPGESNPNFSWEKFHLDNTTLKKKKKFLLSKWSQGLLTSWWLHCTPQFPLPLSAYMTPRIPAPTNSILSLGSLNKHHSLPLEQTPNLTAKNLTA